MRGHPVPIYAHDARYRAAKWIKDLHAMDWAGFSNPGLHVLDRRRGAWAKHGAPQWVHSLVQAHNSAHYERAENMNRINWFLDELEPFMFELMASLSGDVVLKGSDNPWSVWRRTQFTNGLRAKGLLL